MSPRGLDAFVAALEKEKVHTVVRQNEQGFIYGLTFIDHKTKCVFNGSDLGKPYSAKGILERCGHQQTNTASKELKSIQFSRPDPAEYTPAPIQFPKADLSSVLQAIIAPEQQNGNTPLELKRRKRKKRKRISHH